MTHALIDGDVLVYACGFASDAAAKRRMMSERGLDDEGYKAVIADEGAPREPLRNALHGVNEKINAVMNAVDAKRRTIFISHPVNYREQLYPPYKTNRDVTHKPLWYREIKDYLLDKGALFSEEGDEADDALGIAQMNSKNTIICTNDKDLDMIPGLHYNWSPSKIDKGVYSVDEIEGLRHFYTQLITGDSTDNIPGLYKHMGRKAMPALLAPIQEMYFEREMWQYALGLFHQDVQFLTMTGSLLWIKRDNNKWQPPS